MASLSTDGPIRLFFHPANRKSATPMVEIGTGRELETLGHLETMKAPLNRRNPRRIQVLSSGGAQFNLVPNPLISSPVEAILSPPNPGISPPSADEVITKQELAKRLKKTPRCIEQWMRKRYLPYIKIGHTVLFRWQDIVEALRQFTVR